MGFGLLFLGYIFMFSFPYKGVLDVAPDVIGFLIALPGVISLSEYGCGFQNLKKYFILLIPSSVLTLVLQILSLYGIEKDLLVLWNIIYTALLLVFVMIMMVSIHNIADDTGVASIKAKVVRNLMISLIYCFLMIFFSLPIGIIQNLYLYLCSKFAFGFVLYVMGYVWHILNLATVFSCYMWICKEGDEDMPLKSKKNNL